MTLVTAKPTKRRKPVFYNGFDRVFDNFFQFDFPTNNGNTHKGRPAVNILETEKDFQLEFVVPGWEKSDFQIQVEKDLLKVEAEVKKAEETTDKKEDGVTYRRREFGRNSFQRSFQLPDSVNAEAIDAKYHNGILTLTLPKREEEVKVARSIEIS